MPTPPKRSIRSRAAVAGHPLHPVMIHFPVAALLALVASDLGFLTTGDPFWARASLWLAGVGAFGGWVASLAGLIDLVTVRGIRRLVTAWSHAMVAVARRERRPERRARGAPAGIAARAGRATRRTSSPGRRYAGT